MILYILVGIFIGIAVFFIISNILKKRSETEDLSTLLDKKLPDAIKSASEHMLIVAKQQLGAETKDIKTDLSNKKESIEKLVKQLQDEVKQSNKKIEDAERERIGSFRALKQEVEGHRKITEQLSVSTDSLKALLSNNQLRGQFGEQVAEDLLKMTGFVKGVDYHVNKSQKDSETRPDFTIFLPDGVKINVDAKFPYSNLQKVGETQDKSAKREYLKLFEGDVKDKIKQVTSRNYINPEDNTVDFVIMFVPNEMIFSFIYENMNSVWTAAMRQKVIFAGPFSFTAILRLVRQSYDNFKYKNNVRKIITYIKVFEEEWKKYNEEFDKIGDRITSLSGQYEKVNTTRTKQLSRSIDRIRLEEGTTESLFDKESLEVIGPGK